MRDWAALTDLLLQREALLVRRRRGVPADALVGLRVTDRDVDHLLAELAAGDEPSEDDDTEPDDAAGAEAIEQARVAFADAIDDDPVLRRLIGAAELSMDEAEVLAFLVAVDIEPRRQRLLGYIQDDVAAVRPRLHTLLRLFGADHPGVGAVSPDGSLRRACLVTTSVDRPWGTTEVRLAPIVSWAASGNPGLDPALPPGCRVIDAGDRFRGGDRLVLVWGSDRTRRREEACRRLSRVQAIESPLPADAGEWDALVRTATVFDYAVLIETDDLDDVARDRLNRTRHLACAVLTPHALPVAHLPDRGFREYQAPAPEATPDERDAALGEIAGAGHRITAEQLAHLVRAAEGDGVDLSRLAAGPLESLARRIRPRRGFSDLVVPDDIEARLHEIVARYRNRSVVHEDWGVPLTGAPGLTVLFSGQSGTGKTLSAEIIAGELGLDLYKVDLSSVVSKWVGETEKNLEQIFTVAESAQQVLLFDEADAIFGKRSDVSDARDRYANLEVSYLLQRLESYDGLVVLTTNLRNNIDDAFTRRLTAIVDFPMPEVRERTAIWEVSLRDAPVHDDVDLSWFGKAFELSGGAIWAATTTAMYLAADDGDEIRDTHLRHALRREYQKIGRLLPEELHD